MQNPLDNSKGFKWQYYIDYPISVCHYLELCNVISIYWECNNLPSKVIYV